MSTLIAPLARPEPLPDTTPASADDDRPALACQRRGDGPLVVCLHSSTGSQGQWRALGDRLADRAEVLTPDLYGHGRSPAWPAGVASTLDVDAGAVMSLARAQRPGLAREGLHLVGHSYGAAVALRIALRHPQLVRSLTVYEPVLVGLLAPEAGAPVDPALDEIRDIARSVAALVRAGELATAAQVFVAYWGGAGAWHAMSEVQQATIVHRIPTIPRHFDALFAARADNRLWQRLQMPVWLLHGSATRASARAVAERLATLLPCVQREQIAGAGHLGPITHAAAVADAMALPLAASLAAGAGCETAA
ncbi:alpha/beta fold hydrolase [Aquabacterium humicola]|uniref:alpha/beta fold hydrolase n=1 Tax=Aquabacterium humicola TaxID=3237377 RepID=UPI002543F36E|nr:alpha/beta fold hydrolase [Rubrivivax pictus]